MLTALLRFLERAWRWLTGKRPKPDTDLAYSFIQSLEGKMERIKLMWIPSQSDFIESRQVLGKIDGATESVIADALPSSAAEAIVDFPTGALCEVWTRVVGDNGKPADSAHLTFTATNDQVPMPDTGLTFQWMNHIP